MNKVRLTSTLCFQFTLVFSIVLVQFIFGKMVHDSCVVVSCDKDRGREKETKKDTSVVTSESNGATLNANEVERKDEEKKKKKRKARSFTRERRRQN